MVEKVDCLLLLPPPIFILFYFIFYSILFLPYIIVWLKINIYEENE